MTDKTTIAKILGQTRNARLALEIAAWIHDLDKAGWPFAAYLEYGRKIGYKHERQPDRSNKSGWTWAKDWLDTFYEKGSDLLTNGYSLDGLLPAGCAEVKFCYRDNDQDKDIFFTIDPSNSANPVAGDVTSLFKYHSAWQLDRQPWTPWLISAPFGGADGIDSDFFKSALGQRTETINQEFPPKTATPFGLEQPVLGGDNNDPDNFKAQNEAAFAEIWKIALEWTRESAPDIGLIWERVRKELRPLLRRALGYTPKPTHDVTLWDHSYGVGSLAKSLAAALAIDAMAAIGCNRSVLFPLRSPETNLPGVEVLRKEKPLLSGNQEIDHFTPETIQRQVQTKFKVLSILLRDTERLHVGRKVGDILGYHYRRDRLFDTMANIVEKDLALGAEIFRDHAGIHFNLPWCQDSKDAHLAPQEKADPYAFPRSQEMLEEMLHELVACLFGGQKVPEWADTKIKQRLDLRKTDREAKDFDAIVYIGPVREPILKYLKDQGKKALDQGLLFLKDRIRIDRHLDLQNPRPLPEKPTEMQAEVQLCPICRRRAAPKTTDGINENDRPCEVCRMRREGRAGQWWKGLIRPAAGTTGTTIWASEAADESRLITLLSIAFDLDRWFNGAAFRGFWVPGKEDGQFFPIYPAPARIRGVWEACQAFLDEVLDGSMAALDVGKRPVWKVTDGDPIRNNDQVYFLSAPSEAPELGDWFLGKDQAGQTWLAGVSRQKANLLSPDKLKKLVWVDSLGRERRLLSNAEIVLPDEGLAETVQNFLPIVKILTNSPTRWQILAPADKTAALLKMIHDIFLKHFGKVANNLSVCVHALTFRDRFPFYLALESADDAIRRELSRAAWKRRSAHIGPEGLLVDLGDDGPDKTFLGADYQWRCLDQNLREIWRSVVADGDISDDDIEGKYYIWGKESPPSLFELTRNVYHPEVDENFKAKGGVFTRSEFHPGPNGRLTIKAACPRLSWAYVHAAADRHQDQLSIPLLAYGDWLQAYQAVERGPEFFHCKACKEALEQSGRYTSGPWRSPYFFSGLGKNFAQFRHLIDEITSIHGGWFMIRKPENYEDTLEHHIRSLCAHPNGCGPGWLRWAKDGPGGGVCFLAEAFDAAMSDKSISGSQKGQLNSLRSDCISNKGVSLRLASFSAAVKRFEALGRVDGGRPLMVTFALLNRVSGLLPKQLSVGGEK
jgi:hypothetical protein